MDLELEGDLDPLNPLPDFDQDLMDPLAVGINDLPLGQPRTHVHNKNQRSKTFISSIDGLAKSVGDVREENPYSMYKSMDTTSEDSDSSHVLRDEGNFIQNVSQFFNQESLSDVMLKIGDQSFFAHKFVLAKSSDVFRTMLYEGRWTSGNTNEIELNETPECQAVFDKFLRFLYTAEISINVESAVGILCLADKYNTSSLKNLCTRYMVENAKPPKIRNALCWYAWSKALGLGNLIDQCAKTIAWNTDSLLHTQEWLAMDIDFVYDLLNDSSLVVDNEFSVYTAIVQWLLQDQYLPDLKENAMKLLPLIRFPQMMVSQLYEIETSENFSRAEFSEILPALVGKAYRYRSLCPSQEQLQISFSDAFFNPRNYTDLVVDNVRMQNTLRFGIQVDVKTYAGPVPIDRREGEWKITYRKNGDNWTIQIYCHESAMINGEARIQASVIIYNEEEQVIQVEQVPTYVCSRGNHLALNISVDNPEDSKVMALEIKPVPM